MLKRRDKGFTLVELIIVIVILGILAALAVPQFVSSTKDAQDATISADLAIMRNAVNLYYHQHGSNYPGAIKETDGSTATANATEAATAALAQLTKYSNKGGKTNATLDRATYPLGPYLTNGVPNNPANGLNTVKAVTGTAALTATDLDGTAGWVVNAATGEVRAGTAAYLSY